eukprot:1144487-Pelagomonas_calceolata.AAC.1
MRLVLVLVFDSLDLPTQAQAWWLQGCHLKHGGHRDATRSDPTRDPLFFPYIQPSLVCFPVLDPWTFLYTP